ncbi:MAG: S9 family peptidase, partial [Caulobacteraceae bacterium]|nr:S9 family peptidase [Caulobacteraceae bacterium]
MFFRRVAASVGCLILFAAPVAALAREADPYLWLEAVESPAALDWVKAQNARSEPVLTGDSRFAALQAQALTLLAARDRIATPNFVGGTV